jgi:hypothetical protein
MGFVLEIHKTAFQLIEKPLTSIRPLIFQHVELKDSGIDKRETSKVENYLIDIVNKMIDKANILYPKRPERVKMPLIRLKVEGTGYDIVRSMRLASHFQDKIANKGDFLQFYKKQYLLTNTT